MYKREEITQDLEKSRNLLRRRFSKPIYSFKNKQFIYSLTTLFTGALIKKILFPKHNKSLKNRFFIKLLYIGLIIGAKRKMQNLLLKSLRNWIDKQKF